MNMDAEEEEKTLLCDGFKDDCRCFAAPPRRGERWRPFRYVVLVASSLALAGLWWLTFHMKGAQTAGYDCLPQPLHKCPSTADALAETSNQVVALQCQLTPRPVGNHDYGLMFWASNTPLSGANVSDFMRVASTRATPDVGMADLSYTDASRGGGGLVSAEDGTSLATLNVTCNIVEGCGSDVGRQQWFHVYRFGGQRELQDGDQLFCSVGWQQIGHLMLFFLCVVGSGVFVAYLLIWSCKDCSCVTDDVPRPFCWGWCGCCPCYRWEPCWFASDRHQAMRDYEEIFSDYDISAREVDAAPNVGTQLAPSIQ